MPRLYTKRRHRLHWNLCISPNVSIFRYLIDIVAYHSLRKELLLYARKEKSEFVIITHQLFFPKSRLVSKKSTKRLILENCPCVLRYSLNNVKHCRTNSKGFRSQDAGQTGNARLQIFQDSCWCSFQEPLRFTGSKTVWGGCSKTLQYHWSLKYAMIGIRPDITFVLSWFSKYVSKRGKNHDVAAERVLRDTLNFQEITVWGSLEQKSRKSYFCMVTVILRSTLQLLHLLLKLSMSLYVMLLTKLFGSGVCSNIDLKLPRRYWNRPRRWWAPLAPTNEPAVDCLGWRSSTKVVGSKATVLP